MSLFSIVVPVYQNEKNIPETVPALLGLAGHLGAHELELVFVDDGSKDRSWAILLEYVQIHPKQIRAVRLSRNFGQTAAIQAGLRHAKGDCVGIISCDLQEPHEAFVEMFHAWEKGSKFVLGERTERADNWAQRNLSNLFWFLLRKAAFAEYPRLGFDFCLIDRQVVNEINLINEKNSSIFVLIYWLGYRAHRVPVRRESRRQGKSQWTFFRKFGFMADTLIGFTYLPARLITFAGIASAALCLIDFVYLLARWYQLNAAPAGWMTIAGLLLLFSAMVLFSLGIISEYLLRILDEARKRPPFVVDQIVESK
jgi:polyisoprenyl-phosphate glycosyltransferase